MVKGGGGAGEAAHYRLPCLGVSHPPPPLANVYHSPLCAGDGGKAVDQSELRLGDVETSMRDYGFNLVASDVIALNRTLKDTRHQQ